MRGFKRSLRMSIEAMRVSVEAVRVSTEALRCLEAVYSHGLN